MQSVRSASIIALFFLAQFLNNPAWTSPQTGRVDSVALPELQMAAKALELKDYEQYRHHIACALKLDPYIILDRRFYQLKKSKGCRIPNPPFEVLDPYDLIVWGSLEEWAEHESSAAKYFEQAATKSQGGLRAVARAHEAFCLLRLNKLQECIALSDSILKTDKLPYVYRVKAWAIAAGGRFADARGVFASIHDRDRQGHSDDCGGIGYCYFYEKKLQDAWKIFQEMLSEDPQSWSAKYWIAAIYTERGQDDRAMALIQENLRHGDPEQRKGFTELLQEARFKRVDHLIDRESYRAARIAAEQNMRWYPKSARSYAGLARVYFKSKQIHKALATIESVRVQALQPGTAIDAMERSELENLAQLKHGDKILMELHEKFPKDKWLTLRLATLCLSNGKVSMAGDLLRQFTHEHPDSGEGYYWLAQCYLRDGHIDKAEQALTTGLRLQDVPKVETYDARAGIYLNKRDYQNALTDIRASLKIAPTSARYSFEQRILRKLGRSAELYESKCQQAGVQSKLTAKQVGANDLLLGGHTLHSGR